MIDVFKQTLIRRYSNIFSENREYRFCSKKKKLFFDQFIFFHLCHYPRATKQVILVFNIILEFI